MNSTIKRNSTTKTKKKQPRAGKLGTSAKLELALTIRKLRNFSADEIAEAFGVTRQAINWQFKKRGGKNE